MTTCEEMHAPSVIQDDGLDSLCAVTDLPHARVRPKLVRGDLGREVAGVDEDHAVSKQHKIIRRHDVARSGDGDHDIGLQQCLGPVRYRKPVKVRLETFHRVRIEDRDACAKALFEIDSYAFATPAVAEDDDAPTVGDPVRDAERLSTLWPTAWKFSANCLMELSLITSSGLRIWSRSGLSRLRPEVVSSVPPKRCS